MYPHERSLVEKLAGEPFAIIGVNSDDDLEALKPVLEEENITWRSFWNGPEGTQGPISEAWNVQGWPTTYLIDADGVIRFKGPRGDTLDRGIEKLLAEVGHEVDLSDHADAGSKEEAQADDSEEDSTAKDDEDAEGNAKEGVSDEKKEESADGDE